MAKSYHTIRVNSTDYASGIVIELLSWDDVTWNVPAWEERGCSELAGPFESVAQAQAVLEAFMDPQ